MGDGLSITGGANGVAARFDDLHAQATLLEAVASDLGEVASTLARAAIGSDIAEAAALCPIEAAQAEEALLAANVGPHGVAVAWARAEASVAFLRFSIAAYQEIDDLLTRAGDELAFAGGFAAGSLGVPVLAASVLGNPLLVVALWAHRDGLSAEAQELAYEEPWTQEMAARAAPGFVEGATFSLLGGSPVLMALVSGGHWPTSDLQGAMDGLLHVVGPAGLLADSGRFVVKAEGRAESVDLGMRNFFGEVIRQQDVLSEADAVVQVVTVESPSGRAYVVQIPGTQAWGLRRAGNPVDLATNAHLVAGDRTQLAHAVVSAMRSAGIPAGAPVMLTGHSQGGMIAAAIAADPQYRDDFNIRAVLTAGSPIGRIAVPEDVAVLSIEEEQDLVPKLDGAANPDRPNWVTVTRDLDEGSPTERGRTIDAAHSLENYQQTARSIDRSDDSSVKHWRAGNSSFFGVGMAQRYRILPAQGR